MASRNITLLVNPVRGRARMIECASSDLERVAERLARNPHVASVRVQHDGRPHYAPAARIWKVA